MAVLVYIEAHFHAVEVDRTVFVAAFAQLLGKSVEREYLFGIVSLACLDHLLGFLISEATHTARHRADYARIYHLGAVVHLKNDREGQFVLVGTKRTDAVAQMFGQHRHNAIDQIHRRSSALSLAVDYAVGLHIMGHIVDSASSKSLASLGSIVKVVTPRRSSRSATISPVIPASILAAAFSTDSG